MTVYQITTSYMCAGIILDRNGIVTEAADILGWTVGKTLDDVAAWVRKKRGSIRRI